jgi:hypothetical protein
MPTNAYITLQDSSGSGGDFAVVMGGYKPTLEKEQTINRTIGGTIDVSQGAVLERHEYLVRCRDTEDRTGYGTVHELERLWRLNNPNGTPSDKITFIDHYGNSNTAIFIGEFPRSAITTILEGSGAWFFVPISLFLVT